MSGGGTDPAAVPQVRFALPAAALRPFVTVYYLFRAPGPVADSLYPEWGNLRFLLDGAWSMEALTARADPLPPHAGLFGTTDRTRRFATATGGVLMGVELTPLGWDTLIAEPAGPLANRYRALDGELGVPGPEIARTLAGLDDAGRFALLDEVLGAHAAGRTPDPLVFRAHDLLVARPVRGVGEFADLLGVTPGALSRLCVRAFGFTPKRLLRRQRFLRAFVAARDRLDEPLGALVGAEFYDQAHFNREFRLFMGTSPRAYFRSPQEVVRRAIAARATVLGAPLGRPEPAPDPLTSAPAPDPRD